MTEFYLNASPMTFMIYFHWIPEEFISAITQLINKLLQHLLQ